MENDPLLPNKNQPSVQVVELDVTGPDIDDHEEETQIHKDWQDKLDKLSVLQSPMTRVTMVCFILSFAAMLLAPVQEMIPYKLACRSLETPESPVCDPVRAQEIASRYFMWAGVLDVLSLVIAVWILSISDIYGRQRIFVALCAVQSLSMAIFYFTGKYSSGFPFWRLLSSIIVSSLGGGSLILSVLLKAYCTDVSKPAVLAKNFGRINVSGNTGTILGALCSGMLATYGRRHYKLPDGLEESLLQLYAAFWLWSVFVVCTAVFLPESLPPAMQHRSRSASLVRKNRPRLNSGVFCLDFWKSLARDLVRPLRILTLPESLKTESNAHFFPRLRVSFICLMVLDLVMIMRNGIDLLLDQQYAVFKFHWDLSDISFFLTQRSVVLIVIFGLVTPLLLDHVFPRFSHFKTNPLAVDNIESFLIYSCTLIYILASILKAVANSTAAFLTASAISTFLDLANPFFLTAIIKALPPSKVGLYYGGFLFAQESLIFVPFVASRIFLYGVHHNFPGLPFLCAGALATVTIALVFVARRAIRNV